ncbi:MAG: zinc-ribbon domain-containing protein [Betaproteobacteria bacterium]|nr:zinc-ribbon domain-containing protein [Betaproteobacteria bacterium]
MRTRCPVCGTVFRVTSEQLRLKAGKVRCGHCRGVFNAFDQLLTDEALASAPPLPASETAAPPSAGETNEANVAAETTAVKSTDRPVASAAGTAETTADTRAPDEFKPRRRAFAAANTSSLPEIVEPPAAGVQVEEAAATAGNWPETAILLAESPEQSTKAARQAGLVAARELSEAPTYNRWAAGTLAGEASDFAPEEGRRALWPFVIAALLLLLILGTQLAHHFRTEVVRWLPATAAYYELAGIAVPLSRQAELVAIESSDLQFDKLRDLFVLQATLHNRAAYAQNWPALELTLTDAGDTVVARRVMTAADYLPPTISPERFPANGEVAVRLWIEARELGAAGYRLYIFYP